MPSTRSTAYVDGTVDNNSDRTTEFTYNGSGHMLTLKAHLTGGASQTTQFVYGVTTTGGSAVDSNDLLAAVWHPDASSGSSSSSEADVYDRNALGQVATFTDRNGNEHIYSHDVLGRLTGDAVNTLGTGVDGAVRTLKFGYDVLGNLSLATSYDGSSQVVNQVQREFNGLTNLSK